MEPVGVAGAGGVGGSSTPLPVSGTMLDTDDPPQLASTAAAIETVSAFLDKKISV